MSSQKGTYQFHILKLDDHKAGSREGKRYLLELPATLYELLDAAFAFTYLNVLDPKKWRQRTHLEITQLAWDVESLINKYLAEMKARELENGIPDSETVYARFMLPSSVLLGELFGNVRYPKDEVSVALEPTNNSAEMNLLGVAALMDIDEGLVLKLDGKPSEALEYFLCAAEGVRAASVIEALDTAITEFARSGQLGLTSGRARKLATLRHRGDHELRAYAFKLYSEGSWPNKKRAAKAIKRQVIEHGQSIGAELSGDRAFRTIYNWLLREK